MKHLLAAALLLGLAVPGRAVPNFSTKESAVTLGGVHFSSAIFVGATGAYTDAGGGIRAFYIRGSTSLVQAPALSSAVFSARSANGLTFTDESGVRVSSDTKPAVEILISSFTGAAVNALGGGARMLYTVYGTTGSYRMFTATSADGINWGNQYSTAVLTSLNNGNSYMGAPTVVTLNSGDWRLYFTMTPAAGNAAGTRQIYTALSTNQGATWTMGGSVVAGPANEVAAMKRTDGRIRLIYTSPLTGTTTSVQMLSALSTDVNGTAFSLEGGVRLSTGSGIGSMSYPEVIRSTDNFRWRLYYTYTPFAPPNLSTGDVFAAVTDFPDLQGVSPSSVFQTNPNVQFVLTGEIFDTTAMTTMLTQVGQAALNGIGIVRTSDVSMTVTYPTNGAALGYWDAVAANGNGLTSTLTGAVFVDFQGGSANLTDNLFRPMSGGKCKIAVTIFTPGDVVIKLYTINGVAVRTIWSGNLPGGTTNFFWDGTNASGSVVASGVYLLKVTGPKLNATNKIVVVK